MISRLKLLASLVLLAPASTLYGAGPAVLSAETMFDAQGEIWSTPPDEFQREFRAAGYRFESKSARDAVRSYKGALKIFDHPVVESIARFRDGALDEIMFITYSRGDSGEMSAELFKKQLTTLEDKLVTWAGQRPVPVRVDAPSGGVKRAAKVWQNDPHQAKLEWSYSTGSRAGNRKVRPEYVRIFVRRLDRQHDYRSRIHAAKARKGSLVSKSHLKSHVKREQNGDVYVDGVPMVDQGPKGYCVVAVAERVMRYYGRGVDQHEFAQLARSSASQGTDPRAMIEVLRKLSVDLGFKVKVHAELDVGDFLQLIKRYNRVARKKDAPEIEVGRVLYLGRIYQSMKTPYLREARIGQKADYKDFSKTIQEYTDRGMPLLWSVMLGKIEEKNIPARETAGHMRMIIGYNSKEARILYSDTWGPGHELKSMPLEDAWTVTTGLYTVEPRRMSI